MKTVNTRNLMIHEAQDRFGLYGYQIAEILGISEPTWIRWQRKEMPVERQREIVAKIEEAMKG